MLSRPPADKMARHITDVFSALAPENEIVRAGKYVILLENEIPNL